MVEVGGWGRAWRGERWVRYSMRHDVTYGVFFIDVYQDGFEGGKRKLVVEGNKVVIVKVLFFKCGCKQG